MEIRKNGLSETLGLLSGESKVISDLQQETLAEFVRMQFIQLFESIKIEIKGQFKLSFDINISKK
jgi:hypothetical protein